ncbi:MAG: GWxTD domain-containing protein, partial [Ignavibacterium album]|uniref:GWxTD domain-containing protein n=1 Tax=Ignavibacterium album TaxID=591197 RepID=UPI0026F18FD4
MKLLITFLLMLSFIAVAQQDQNFERNFKLSYEAFFHQDFVNFRSDKPGMTRVDVYIQVPYKSLQFIKTGQGFTAKYSVVVSVFDESKNRLIVEKTWNETINVIDFAQTTSRLNYNVGFKSFELKPGNYFFRTAVIDSDSKKEVKSENTFKVRELNPELDMSDVLLVTRSDSKSNQVMPNIPRNVTLSVGGLQFFYEIYSADSLATNCTIDYEILDKESKVLYKKSVLKDLSFGKNQVVESLDDLRLDLGTFILRTTLKDKNFKTLTSLNKSFFSRWVGLPGSVTDIDKAISQMVYIATPDELSKLKDSKTNEEKLKNFLEFWKKKDPSPNNEENEVFNEYFRRVAYA